MILFRIQNNYLWFAWHRSRISLVSENYRKDGYAVFTAEMTKTYKQIYRFDDGHYKKDRLISNNKEALEQIKHDFL